MAIFTIVRTGSVVNDSIDNEYSGCTTAELLFLSASYYQSYAG